MNFEGIPDQISSSQIRSALADLGIRRDDVVSVRISPQDVTVTIYALNEGGQRYFSSDWNDDVAQHRLVIQITHDDDE